MLTEFTKASTIRDHVLRNVSIILALFVLIVAATNLFLTHDYALGLIEVVISLVFFHIYYKARANDPLTWQPSTVAILVTAGLLYGFYYTNVNSAIVMWVFVLPPLYQLLFNRVIGTLATLFMYVATTTIYFPNVFNNQVYPFAFVNFTIPYAMIWLIAYNHEAVRINVQNRLEQIARTDALTGALNRLALQQDASSQLHCCGTSHLLHFDLDWFKQINDAHGHSAGDEVLKLIVKEAQLRIPSSKIYRIGGEEFCIIFSAEDIDGAFEMSESLRKSIERRVLPHKHAEIQTTISGGLLELPHKCQIDELDKALQRTDRALYKAKNSGRNLILLA